MTVIDRLAGASRIGLGLAAVGRPGYITLGREADLPAGRTVEAMRARPDADDVVVGSKWGYTYVAGWRVDAEAHEVKDHSVATFDRQLGESRALLGDRLDLYQIHSVTPDSPALHDEVLHRRLADLAAQGIVIGLSTSGPGQAEAIRAALGIRVGGRPLFRSVQATWNPLEPSAGPALAEAHDAGCVVIVKEALANGRLARAGAPADAVALAAALQQPWATVVLSGAVTSDQLASNLRAQTLTIDPAQWQGLAVPSARYWHERSQLPWA